MIADAIGERVKSDARLEAAGLKRLSFTDYSEIPDQLEREIDAGRMQGIITLYRLSELEPGRTRIGSMFAGLSTKEAFDILSDVRQSMMALLGFVDPTDGTALERVDAPMDREDEPK